MKAYLILRVWSLRGYTWSLRTPDEVINDPQLHAYVHRAIEVAEEYATQKGFELINENDIRFHESLSTFKRTGDF
jgi:hypothetical protein